MPQKLSVVLITRNAASTIAQSLESVQSLANEIVVVDDNSTDQTRSIAARFEATVVSHHEPNLGKQKNFAVSQATNKWVLVLDSDEIVTPQLAEELSTLLQNPTKDAYYIRFQTHLFGKPLHYGGEYYEKLVFFDRSKVSIQPASVHEAFLPVTQSVGKTKNKIAHYSYRTILQMYKKFTDYALKDAESKFRTGEKANLKNIFLYPPHMFWARFITDQGYKDGFARIILDLGFAYMEFLTYFKLLMIQLFK